LSNTTITLVQERAQLQIKVGNLEATCEALRMSAVVAAQVSQETISALELDLLKSKAIYEKLQAQIKSMVETPRGLRKRVRVQSIKRVDELARGS